MPNEFFTPSGTPSTGGQVASSPVRSEFASIEAAFDKLPTMAGNGDETVVINAGGTALSSKTAAEMRTLLGLVIGTNVQAYDAELAALAGLVSAADKLAYFTGSGTASLADLTSVARTLIAQATQALMRTTGLGATATGDAVFTAASAAAARTTLGAIGLADNNTFTGNNTFNKEIILGASSEVATANSLQVVGNAIYHIATGQSWIFKAQGTGSAADRLSVYESGGVVGHDGSGVAATGGAKGSGNANFWAVWDQGNRVYSSASGSMSESVSAIATNSTNARAHNLGSIPKLTQYRIRCIAAGGDRGYALNDEVEFSCKTTAVTETPPSAGWCDATNFGVVMNTEILVRDKAAFTMQVITNGNWNFVLRAWK